MLEISTNAEVLKTQLVIVNTVKMAPTHSTLLTVYHSQVAHLSGLNVALPLLTPASLQSQY